MVRLYRAFGFPLRTASLALAVMACTQFFNLPFTNYPGGEVLLFGVAPWFVLMAWKLRDLRWFAVFPLAAGIAVMVFANLNEIVIGAAVVGGAAVCGDNAWRRRDTVPKLVMAGVTIALMGGIFYVSWYMRGATAASIPGEIHRDGPLFYISFGVGSLWSSVLSLLDLCNCRFLNSGRQILSSGDGMAYAYFPLALATYAIAWMRLHHAYGECL